MDVVDGYHGSLKAKRARATQVKHKSTINLFNKISDMIEKLAELVDIQELTDTTILQVRIDRIDHHRGKNEWGKMKIFYNHHHPTSTSKVLHLRNSVNKNDDRIMNIRLENPD